MTGLPPVYDQIVFGKTALWQVYKNNALEPFLQKIVPIIDGRGIAITLSQAEIMAQPKGKFPQTITSRRGDGTLNVHTPLEKVEFGTQDVRES